MPKNVSVSPPAVRVGLISDTHDLLRPEAKTFLEGCVHIVHGGDIGGPEILDELRSIAPVSAVRGNNDTGAWARLIPEAELIRVAGVCIYAIHDRAQLDVEPSAVASVVMSGHSHKPLIEEHEHVLFVNPGSAGPRRFQLPISLGELLITGSRASARIVALGDHATWATLHERAWQVGR